MAEIVGIHGIGQQLKGPQVLREEWLPALLDGIHAAGGAAPSTDALRCAFYGDAFRPPGKVRNVAATSYAIADMDADDVALLSAIWERAAQVEPDRVQAPEAKTRATPNFVQAGLRALSRSRFFARLSESALIFDLKQVTRYLKDRDVRDHAHGAVDAVVTPSTRVVIGHSLGSVVAYEALHRYSASANWANVTTLITLGSPLGIPNLIFEALTPVPVGGKGVWPARLKRWTNISDDGDVVALEKHLRNLFGPVVDVGIDNGADAHNIRPYLTAPETGMAVLDGLA